jgi:cell division protein FtsW (lipid II flippase)
LLDRLKFYLRGVSWPIILAMALLMTISVLAVRSAEQADPDLARAGMSTRQMAYVAVASMVFLVAAAVPYQKIGPLSYLAFAVTLGLLVLVLFLEPIRHSHRWIDLGVVQFQPSELAKLTYILALAWYLRYRDSYRRLSGLIIPFVLTVVPAGLILVEPDLGTTLLLPPTLMVMLFMAGARLKHLSAVVGLGAVVLLAPVPRSVGAEGPAAENLRSLAYWRGEVGGREYVLAAAPLTKMKPHQLSRIVGWIHQPDPRTEFDRGKGFQLQQSMIILGAGQFTGQSRIDQRDLYFRMLPDDHTDFIYAVIGGRWGLAGCAAVLGIYAVIFICAVEIAAITDDPFGRLVVVGVMAILFSQIVINIGMTMGLMPITGMTLPLISFGGSSMVVNAAALGLLVNVGIRRPIELGRKPFEFGAKPEKASRLETMGR